MRIDDLAASLGAAGLMLESPDGTIRLDRAKRALWLRDGKGFELGPGLTPREFELLCFLLRNPGRALDRSELLERVWRKAGEVNPETVDKHVAVLRRKLGKAGRTLKTLRGEGYCLG